MLQWSAVLSPQTVRWQHAAPRTSQGNYTSGGLSVVNKRLFGCCVGSFEAHKKLISVELTPPISCSSVRQCQALITQSAGKQRALKDRVRTEGCLGNFALDYSKIFRLLKFSWTPWKEIICKSSFQVRQEQLATSTLLFGDFLS